MSTILCGLASLKLRPNAKFVHALLSAALESDLAAHGSAEDLQQLAWALPRLRHPLPEGFGPALVQLAERQLPDMERGEPHGLGGPQAVREVVQGLGLLGLQVQGHAVEPEGKVEAAGDVEVAGHGAGEGAEVAGEAGPPEEKQPKQRRRSRQRQSKQAEQEGGKAGDG